MQLESSEWCQHKKNQIAPVEPEQASVMTAATSVKSINGQWEQFVEYLLRIYIAVSQILSYTPVSSIELKI